MFVALRPLYRLSSDMAVDLLNLLLFLLPTIINEAAAACGPGAYYNASGSVEIPFPQPPTSSGVPDNYTLFTRLAFPSGPHGLSQSFGAVNASGYPVLDLSLDYQGCLLVLEGSSFQATKDHVNAPNKASCEAALSQDCIDDIIESANERANQISRDNGTTNWKCHISMPSKCNKIDSKYSSKYNAA